MIDNSTYLLFVAASAAVVAVPGPTVTVIIANSLRGGSRTGLLNVAGTQCGVLLMTVVLAAGLSSVVTATGRVFDVLRLLGATYLIWLGVKLWRADGSLADTPAGVASRRASGYFWQGFLVIWSNPKALFFFGAFIPQFVDPAAAAAPQVLLLGLTFIAVATVFDSAYAIAAGRVGGLLSRRNLRVLERVSGSCLIGGGLWLALERR